MRYLAILAFLAIAGCDDTTPDFHTCPKDVHETINEFMKICVKDNASWTCRDTAQELYCIPGYKPKHVEECICPEAGFPASDSKEW